MTPKVLNQSSVDQRPRGESPRTTTPPPWPDEPRRTGSDPDSIEGAFVAPASSTASDSAGFAVLVFDRWTLETGQLRSLLDYLDMRGLNPLLARLLSAAEAEALLGVMGTDLRHPKLEPAALIAVLDLSPSLPGSAELRRIPTLDNRRLARLEKQLQKKLEKIRFEGAGEARVHFSPNSARAWEYLRAVVPEHEASLRERVREWREAFTTPFPVLRAFPGRNDRARVEIVEFEGRPAVCKTFRPGKEYVLQRELEAMLTLRPTMEEVPEVLAHGENWMVMPLYQHVPRRSLGGLLFPLDRAKQVVAAVERIHEAGYSHLDLQPANLIFDERAGLKILDWEWAVPHPNQPRSFEENYDITGVPDAARSTVGSDRKDCGYPWQLQIGLSLRSLREDARWKQHLKRALYVAFDLLPKRSRKALYRHVKVPLRGLFRNGERRPS